MRVQNGEPLHPILISPRPESSPPLERLRETPNTGEAMSSQIVHPPIELHTGSSAPTQTTPE